MDGNSVYSLSPQEVSALIVGPPNSTVELLISKPLHNRPPRARREGARKQDGRAVNYRQLPSHDQSKTSIEDEVDLETQKSKQTTQGAKSQPGTSNGTQHDLNAQNSLPRLHEGKSNGKISRDSTPTISLTAPNERPPKWQTQSTLGASTKPEATQSQSLLPSSQTARGREKEETQPQLASDHGAGMPIGSENSELRESSVSFNMAVDTVMFDSTDLLPAGPHRVAADITDRDGSLVHISPRRIESRLNDSTPLMPSKPSSKIVPFSSSRSSRQDTGKVTGVAQEAESDVMQGLVKELSMLREQVDAQAATIQTLSIQGHWSSPDITPEAKQSKPDEDRMPTLGGEASTTRAEAVMSAAAAVDAAAKALKEVEERQSLLFQPLSDPLGEKEQGGDSLQSREEQDQGQTRQNSSTSAKQKINDAFLLLSSKSSPARPSTETVDAPDLSDDKAKEAQEGKSEEAKQSEPGNGDGGSMQRADIPDLQAYMATVMKQRQEEMRSEPILTVRVKELEEALKSSDSRVKEKDAIATERAEQLAEAEARLGELHAILDQVSDVTKEEVEAEILVTRRIATFRAVRIAVLQQQCQQLQDQDEREKVHQDALRALERQHADKLKEVQNSNRSVLDLKTREIERQKNELQTAASKIARMQQETRRLQRLLGSRMDFIPEDTHAPQDSAPKVLHTSPVGGGWVNGVDITTEGAVNTSKADLTTPTMPLDTKPRAGSSGQTSFLDATSMLPRGPGRGGGDVVLVNAQADMRKGIKARGLRAGDDSSSEGDSAGGGGGAQEAEPRSTSSTVQPMQWSSTTSSDEDMDDRVSHRRAVSSAKVKKKDASARRITRESGTGQGKRFVETGDVPDGSSSSTSPVPRRLALNQNEAPSIAFSKRSTVKANRLPENLEAAKTSAPPLLHDKAGVGEGSDAGVTAGARDVTDNASRPPVKRGRGDSVILMGASHQRHVMGEYVRIHQLQELGE